MIKGSREPAQRVNACGESIPGRKKPGGLCCGWTKVRAGGNLKKLGKGTHTRSYGLLDFYSKFLPTKSGAISRF